VEQNCKRCPKCGEENERDSYFCAECGAFIRSTGVTVPVFRRHFRPAADIGATQAPAAEEPSPFSLENAPVRTEQPADFCDPMDDAVWDQP